MKKLIIAEKPSLAKKIGAALGVTGRNSNGNLENDEVVIHALVGHVIEAKYPKTPWILDNLPLQLENPEMVPSKGKEQIVSKLKKEINRADIDEIVNAGDADTEGSLLVYELYEFFNVLSSGKKFTRMWILAEDKKTIKAAYDNRYSQDEDMKFVNTGKSRSLADVRLGFNFSRLYTLKGAKRGESFAIGRVMTPTMQIVRNREIEIENFVPEDYWTIKGIFSKEAEKFDGDLFIINDEGKQTTSLNKERFDYFKSNISESDTYSVKEKSVKLNSKKPDFLPNLNDILKSMSRLHKLNPKKTTSIMQELYEAQFCTYPRSESKFLPTSMEAEVDEVFCCYEELCTTEIGKNSINFNIKNKRIFDDTKVGSHFAIIPMVKTASQISSLGTDQRRVFDYITSKFMMAFMDEYKYESTVIVLNKDDISFKITGKIEKSQGFKGYDCASNNTKSEDTIVPPINEGDDVNLNKIATKKNKTKPPSAITALTLLEIMENVHKLYKKQKLSDDESDNELEFDGSFSLGTPATRGAIIDKLLSLTYLKKSGQKMIVSEVGKALLNTVKTSIDIETTAKFEEDISNILSGKQDHNEFDTRIDKYVHDVINKEAVEIKDIQKAKADEAKTGHDCPLCSEKILQTEKSYRCSAAGTWDKSAKTFSGCQFGIIKHIPSLKYDITKEDLGKLLDGEKLDINGKKIVYDKDNRFFIKIEVPSAGVKCPLCESDVKDTERAYRCSAAGTWDQKAKTFSGCQFGIIKHIPSLKHDISKDDLGQLLKGEKLEINGKKIVFDKDNRFFIKIELPKVDLQCPLCESDVVDTGKGYRCSAAGAWDQKAKKFSGCQLNVMKHIKPLKWDLSIEDLKKLISGEVIEVDGKKVTFDKNNNFFINIDFGNGPASAKLETKCPMCEGGMLETPKVFRCENTGKWDPKKKKMDGSCKFTIFKNNRNLGRDISAEELHALITEGVLVSGSNKVTLDLKSKFFTA